MAYKPARTFKNSVFGRAFLSLVYTLLLFCIKEKTKEENNIEIKTHAGFS